MPYRCCTMSSLKFNDCRDLIWQVQDIPENLGESHYFKIWKLWRVLTENGEPRTHLSELQGSLNVFLNIGNLNVFLNIGILNVFLNIGNLDIFLLISPRDIVSINETVVDTGNNRSVWCHNISFEGLEIYYH